MEIIAIYIAIYFIVLFASIFPQYSPGCNTYEYLTEQLLTCGKSVVRELGRR